MTLPMGAKYHLAVDLAVRWLTLNALHGSHCHTTVIPVVPRLAWILREEHNSNGCIATLGTIGTECSILMRRSLGSSDRVRIVGRWKLDVGWCK